MSKSKKPGWPRFAILIVTAFVTVLATMNALVNILHSRDADTALMIDGDDPVALVGSAQSRISAGLEVEGGSRGIATIARNSVTQSPINAAAFRLFGIVNSFNAEDDRAETTARQMRLADRMSRRDLGAQLWLIEEAVNRNDVADVLSHYDAALRVNDSMQPVLYPVLTEAMDEPAIRRRFEPYMQSPPPWLETFLRFAVSNSNDPTNIAALAEEAGGFPKGEAYSTLDRELLTRMVGVGQVREAVAYYLSREGNDPQLLRSLAMTDESVDEAAAPVGWLPTSVDGIEPIFLAGDSGIELEIAIDRGYGGRAAEKLLALPTGRYRVVSQVRGDRSAVKAEMTWQIRCADSEEPRMLAEETFDIGGTTRVDMRFTVPGGCAVQQLFINVATDPSPGTLVLTVPSPQLARTGS